ncbi:MAG TPA: hypothetical protein VHD33_00115 [Legionellaceae bacterium]|nr:hypothetical protein [Legionellaceae bacterium]
MLKALLIIFVCNGAMATDFSGLYECQLTDHSDGPFTARLILKKDESASFSEIDYGSYLVTFHVTGIPYDYSGMAAARGNELALYFESVGQNKNPDDRGVGIASMIVDQDKDGKKIVSLHKFYYEKSYKKKSNYGFERCIKIQ